ncbi:MAG: hypothetical protein ACR5K7_04760 [Symbiopectobacterium sp.]
MNTSTTGAQGIKYQFDAKVLHVVGYLLEKQLTMLEQYPHFAK